MESYRYDLIDVGRQAISAQFGTKLNEYKTAFEKGDADGAATLETACLAIIVSRQPVCMSVHTKGEPSLTDPKMD